MTQITVQPSPKALHQFLVATVIMTAAVCGFATLFFWRLGHFRPRVAMTFIALTWVIVPGVWLIASALTAKKWRKTTVTLGEDYLTVQKSSLFGGSKQQMYRYEAMLSIRTDQSYWGKKRGYGTLYIAMPRPEHEVVLTHLPDPERYAVFIKDRIASRRPHPHVETV